MGGAASQGFRLLFPGRCRPGSLSWGQLCRSGVGVEVSPPPRQPPMQSTPSPGPAGREADRSSEADLKETGGKLSRGRAPAQGRPTLGAGQRQTAAQSVHTGLPETQ